LKGGPVPGQFHRPPASLSNPCLGHFPGLQLFSRTRKPLVLPDV
jgi:hypothetical protein